MRSYRIEMIIIS